MKKHHGKSVLAASILAAAGLLAACAGAPAAAKGPASSKYKNVGYVFQRGSDISKLDVTKITHLNYSFGLIYNEEYKERGPENNPDVATPTVFYPEQLHTIYLPPKVASDLTRTDELKAKNPALKVLLSVGGFDARGFSDAAATEEARKAFAASCRETIDYYALDGIDLDWEYPINGGWGSIKNRPEDKRNFTLLLQAVRDAIGRDKLLSIAGSANLSFTGRSDDGRDGLEGTWTEFDKIVPILDYVNIMTYDFQYGTNYFGSGLYASKEWPTEVEGDDYNCEKAVRNYLANGCPPEKINLGLAFAAPTPEVVRAKPFYPAVREKLTAAGWYASHEPGLKRVKDILEDKNGFTKEWDPDARTAYIAVAVDGKKEFLLSYIEKRGLSAKLDYVKELGLGGTMFWEFGSDYDNSLVTQIADELGIAPAR